jgi:hypothetical protein
MNLTVSKNYLFSSRRGLEMAVGENIRRGRELLVENLN